MTKKIDLNVVANVIDKLGMIKAKIADLKEQENELKGLLIDNGDGAYEGRVFRATVSTFDRETLDMDAVRAKLTPQFIKAHSTVTEVSTVRVTARTGALAKALEAA